MIEGLTYRYMKSLSSEPLDTLMGDQLFKARIKLIKHLVERIKGKDEEKGRALRYIQKAEKLAETRNVIAHNPWQIWIDFERDDFRTEIQKYTKKEKTFDLTAVRKFTEDAREAASGLEYALSALTSSSSGLPTAATEFKR
jgi:hypothetical protein